MDQKFDKLVFLLAYGYESTSNFIKSEDLKWEFIVSLTVFAIFIILFA